MPRACSLARAKGALLLVKTSIKPITLCNLHAWGPNHCSSSVSTQAGFSRKAARASWRKGTLRTASTCLATGLLDCDDIVWCSSYIASKPLSTPWHIGSPAEEHQALPSRGSSRTQVCSHLPSTWWKEFGTSGTSGQCGPTGCYT